MFEMHSWVVFRETYECRDDEEENIDAIVGTIKKMAEELKWNTIEIKVRNGEYYLEYSIFSNRRCSDFDEYIEFIEKIIKLAQGSYGLIYFLDEDDPENCNEFQVLSIVRGLLCAHKDGFLSPFIPIVEDPWK